MGITSTDAQTPTHTPGPPKLTATVYNVLEQKKKTHTHILH
jgi:hypothetical protein